MAKIGNETKLVLKLAKERADVKEHLMPTSVRGNSELTEAWVHGFMTGQQQYDKNLDSIVLELLEG